MRILSIIGAGIFVSALAFVSCKEDKKSEETRSVFKYNEMGGINSLDPAEASSFENIWAVNQLFNGLVQMDDSLRVIPAIAKSWEITEDERTYVFHLRSDVYFHDSKYFKDGKGRKVTASDFEYSFFRLFDPNVSRALSLMDIVDRSERSNYKGCVAKDDSTFVIYIKQPFRPFLNILTMKFFSVVPFEAVDGMGEEFGKSPVGTGPFAFKMWDASKIIFLKNENYFEFNGNERLPYLEAINISFIRDKQSAFLQLMRGELDLISGTDAVNIDAVFDNNGKLNKEYEGKFQVQTSPYLKTDYLGFLIDEKIPTIAKSPVHLKAIRQAINFGFDREKMMKYFRNNIGTAAMNGFVPPGLPTYNTAGIKGYHFNPEKVKQLLLEAGYPDGKGLPEIELHTTEQYTDLIEYIQGELLKNNIKIKINVEPARELKKAVQSNEYEFFKKSWVCDYPDAENFLFMFHSNNFSPVGQNYFHYRNPDFDALYEKARKETNDSMRNSYYHQMDQMIIDDAPVVPLYYDQVVRLVSNQVSGLTPNPMNLLNLKKVKKAETKEQK